MFLAPIGTLLIGLTLGFLKGFQKPRLTLRSTLALATILGIPALFLYLDGADPAIFGILVGGLLITYLSLQAGLLIGDWIARRSGRRAP